MNLVCFTEERSAKEMLQIVLLKILPKDYRLSTIIVFEGKSDLDNSNTSISFNTLLSGVKKLCTMQP